MVLDDVATEEPALWVRHGPPPVMTRPHRHDDLELNLVHSGALEYLFGGSALRVEAGEIALFWGGTPHRLVDPQPPMTEASWVHLPLAEVLGWGLPRDHLAVLLQAQPVVVPAAALGRDVAGMLALWHDDVVGDGDRTVVMLEAQAFVRRLALAAARPDREGGRPPLAAEAPGVAASATAMARFVAEHYREPITAAEVAASVPLSVGHAMTLFRRVVGTTIGTYLARCRVAEAQRLLLTTDRSTAEIGAAAGFSSQSSYYETFRQICGLAPGQYRRTFR